MGQAGGETCLPRCLAEARKLPKAALFQDYGFKIPISEQFVKEKVYFFCHFLRSLLSFQIPIIIILLKANKCKEKIAFLVTGQLRVGRF